MQVFKQGNLQVHNTWRILSRATEQPTSMFRILTRCRQTLDTLLTSVFTMFYRVYRCEPSRVPAPQPLAFGHETNSCRLPRTCGTCASAHPVSTPCTSAPKFANCSGPHPSFSHKCPKRPTEVTPQTAAPIKTVDLPAEDASDGDSDADLPERFACVSDAIRFVQHTLINAFPDRIEQIVKVLRLASEARFKRTTLVSVSGNKFRCTVRPNPNSSR